MSAGWGGGADISNDAVRFAAASWLDGGGKVDRNKLASAVSGALGKALSAAPHSAGWNSATGELTLKFKRPSLSFPGLGLTDTIEVTALAAPEKPGSAQALVIWLTGATLQVEDEGPEPRLNLAQSAIEEDSESVDSIDMASLVAALAGGLKGQAWDPDASVWKK